MIGGIVAALHPTIDVFLALDIPFMDMRFVAECPQLAGNPVRPLISTAHIINKVISHASLGREIHPGSSTIKCPIGNSISADGNF